VFVSWIVFPLLLGVLSLGCGLLVEAACRVRFPGALLAPAGLALVVVAGQLATATDATAELTVPLAVGLAVAGFALAPSGRFRELDGWALAAAVGVLAVFAAPIVMSGDATFAGYQRLDDTTFWFGITDRVMEHGRNLGGLPPSGYRFLLESYIGNGYPIGSFLPLGIGHMVLGTDVAWLFQPAVAFFAAMLALALYTLATPLIASRPLRALVAFLASQPAILVGYALWGGIKEVAGAWLVATAAALLIPALRERAPATIMIPIAVAATATLATLSVAAGVWLAVPLLGCLALVLASRGSRPALLQTSLFGGVALVLSVPAIVEASDFLRAKPILTSGKELGILNHPLNTLQVLGIWPSSDLRLAPSELGLTHVLLAVLITAGVVGLTLAVWRRAFGPSLYFFGAAVGCLVVAAFGSPWVDGKAFAIASPAFVFVGLLGALAAFQPSGQPVISFPGLRAVGALIAVAIGVGVLWSNVLAYRGVELAPRDRLGELEQIGKRIAGQGPTLTTDSQPFAHDHFLRNAAPDRFTADVDRFSLQTILKYRTLVVRRSPLASRPPSTYRLVSSGRYYEIWQRAKTGRRTIEHLPLGSPLEPTARPTCADIRRLAGRAGRRGLLAAVRRPAAIVLRPPRDVLPSGWKAVDAGKSSPTPGVRYIVPSKSGTLRVSLDVPAAARYGVWIGANFRRRMEVQVDGKLLAAKRHRLNALNEYEPMGTVELGAGRHQVALRYSGASLWPGSGGKPRAFGPVVLSATTAASPVSLVQPQGATSLCGQRLDWVEALGAR
jgi:hypothetical protein